MSIGDEHQVVSHNGSRNRDISATLEAPDLFSSCSVISSNMFISIEEKKFSISRAIDGLAAPGRNVFARGAPDFFPIFETEGCDKGAFLHIALQKYLVFEDDGRASEAPLSSRHHIETGVQHTEILLPEQLSFHVITEEAFRPEHCHHTLSISCRGGTRMGRLRVAFDFRNTSVGNLFPEDFARSLVQAINHPLMAGVILYRFYIAVQTHSERGVCLSTNGGGDEELVTPDDRAGMSEPRYRCLPLDVLAGRHIPFGRSSEPLGDAAGIRTAERRPMNLRRNRIARQGRKLC